MMPDSSLSSGRNLQDASPRDAGPPLNAENRRPIYSYSRTSSGPTSSGQQVQGIISRQTSDRPCLSIPARHSHSNLLEPIRIGSARQSLDTPAHMMESSTSPVVQIPQWYNKGPSTGFAQSPGLQRLSQQSRVSPIDALRNSNHPYTKNRPPISASSSRRGSASLASGESDSNKNVPLSSGLKDSPRRKRRPEFPTSPRSIVRREGEDYAMDSPLLDYTQTPSILRVPFTPLPLGMHSGTPGPQSARPEYYTSGSGMPTSSVRDTSPGKAVSSGSTRQTARTNAVSRDRPKTDSIPRSYVLKSLNNLAPHFWNRPATADCRISELFRPDSTALTDMPFLL
jgi:hypothetical protein